MDAPLPTLGERQRIDKVGAGVGAGALNGGRFGVFIWGVVWERFVFQSSFGSRF